ERYGGGGYPHALAGDEISLAARIVSVADSFEVMTAARSYKKPMSVPAARRELAACAGEQFDPAIVRAFLNVSLGRLWWSVGPMSWAALAPILGPVQRAGSQLAAAATGTTAAVVVGVAGLLPGATSASATPVPPVSERAVTQAPQAPAADHPAAGDARSGGIGGEGPGRGAGAHADVPGPGSGSGRGEEPTGNGGSGGAGGLPGGGIGVDDTVGGLNDVVKDTTDDDVVDGATDAVTGAVDGATDVVDDLLGGAGVSDLVDEPVEDLTDLLGGLLGS
ncbi:MAG TPA: HD domain-containing phosphohydrolase, partial [Actinomycetota bacterium]|nr:HD domain-containing phosphohydrolase [Actinomycetota bacterium]